MDFRIPFDIKALPQRIRHKQSILLTGSCFTEHMVKYLAENKFTVLGNPNGILFNPVSITSSLLSYIEPKQYTKDDLFYFNESWHSWDHHSRFSAIESADALTQINASQTAAHHFLKSAGWLVITLGSAFVYEWTEKNSPLYPVNRRRNDVVANCHKIPQDKFRKRLMSAEEVLSSLDELIYRLFLFNPGLRIIFTISPVRHLRDGLIENNKSKAVLIQAVHTIADKFEKLFYFPAYELLIDELRDYRFYAEDMVHPNYLATDYVWEKFTAACIDPSAYTLMKEMQKINMALKHRPFNPASAAHRQFLRQHAEKVKQLKEQFPYIDFTNEMNYFGYTQA
ncbi:MAG: GSCFA domain-containing protein [Sphingobacteriales bacterium]|nr:GSCFA domain-containing protein [Sphingobacteriales bacterium]OJY90996.1 MAG: GSCFA domain-containing protein [Sphingobacteriales bacterium 44-15]